NKKIDEVKVSLTKPWWKRLFDSRDQEASLWYCGKHEKGKKTQILNKMNMKNCGNSRSIQHPFSMNKTMLILSISDRG
ncbi:hypothetical protein AKJ18_36665, partial [Vibrio xuii]